MIMSQVEKQNNKNSLNFPKWKNEFLVGPHSQVQKVS